MTARTRSFLVFGAKVLVAVGLITWLLRSGSLNVGALKLFLDSPSLLVANLVMFTMGVFVGALRWRELLKLAGVRMPYLRAVQLQLTALFFNTVIPGNVGGDLIKSVYAAREAHPSKRPMVYLIVFVDRLLGLGGLVLVACVMTAVRADVLWRTPRLRELAFAVALLAVATLVGPIVVLALIRVAGARLEALLSGTTKLSKLLSTLVSATRLVAEGPKTLVLALIMSMLMHACAMFLFTAITRVVTAQDVALSSVAAFYPIGILSMMLPISPAGIGVGHATFDWLFSMVGLPHGADVFNIYLIGQMAPCLVGAIPYLMLKREGRMPTGREATVATPEDSGS